MINWIMNMLFPKAQSTLDYVRERINYNWAEEGSDVHFVQVHGMLLVYSYDDWCRTSLDIFSNTVHTDALIAAKRLKLPVRYYYREGNRTDFVHYDCRRRGIGMSRA